MEMPCVKQLWDKIGGVADTFMHEKLIDLYLTVRRHATAKRVVRLATKQSSEGRKKSTLASPKDSQCT